MFIHLQYGIVFMFSKACEYGIRASIYIAKQSQLNYRVGLKDIAQAIDSPEAFTAKILQQLVKSGIITSVKGPTGGFEMDKKQLNQITLKKIVYAIDGDTVYKGCGLGLKECSEKSPCPLHDKFKAIRDELNEMLTNTTIADLANDLHQGATFLRR